MIKILFKKALNSPFGRLLSDELYIKTMYRLSTGQKLNLESPQTFGEKLQWLKLNNRTPEYTMYADKYEVRKYIRDKIGEEYLVPLLGVWDRPEDIDFSILPDKFVLKCNHNSGTGMYICTDKSRIDTKSVVKGLKKGINENYYLKGREWPYKNIRRRIIAEKFLADNSGGLIDYKFFCFNGYVDCVMVCIDRHINDTKFYFFDNEWNLKRINVRGKNAPDDFTLPKPDCISEMFKITETLSKNFPFVRVDLYESEGTIYFSELTFYPSSGFDPNILPETDAYFGTLIDLSGVNTREE